MFHSLNGTVALINLTFQMGLSKCSRAL